jgi:26S proteasome regulatory subunit N11
MAISYRKSALEERMLLNLQKRGWTSGLTLKSFTDHADTNAKTVGEFKDLSAKYDKAVVEEAGVEIDRRGVARAGKTDARRRLEDGVGRAIGSNIVQCMGSMLDTVAF